VIEKTFPVQIPNLFQALELVFIGVFKKLKHTAVGDINDESADSAITRLIQVYKTNCDIYHNKNIIAKSRSQLFDNCIFLKCLSHIQYSIIHLPLSISCMSWIKQINNIVQYQG
jgi:hypothetical protein